MTAVIRSDAAVHHTVGVQLTDELRDEHDLIDRVAGAFDAYGASPSGPDIDDGRRFLNFFRLYAGDFHHAREEQILFCALADRLELPADRGPLAVLTADHRRMAAMLADLDRLLGDGVEGPDARRILADIISAYVDALAHHIDAENSVLLPESESRLLKRNIRELPSRPLTSTEKAARVDGEALVTKYPPSRRERTIRGDGCVLCPAMGDSCRGLEAEWWNEWEWEEFEDHLPSG